MRFINVEFTGKWMKLPEVTSSERDSIVGARKGYTIFNGDTLSIETYNGTIWTASGGGSGGATGLRGATGTQGTPGALGATGASGVIGATGVNGSIGGPGVTGAQGYTGSNGVAGANGATGLQGLIGLQGFTGVNGTTGLQGYTGTAGQTGVTGVTGSGGATGLRGLTGLSGSTGTAGATGIPGLNGLNGSGQGLTGLGTPNTVAKFGTTGSLANSSITDNGSTVLVSAAMLTASLDSTTNRDIYVGGGTGIASHLYCLNAAGISWNATLTRDAATGKHDLSVNGLNASSSAVTASVPLKTAANVQILDSTGGYGGVWPGNVTPNIVDNYTLLTRNTTFGYDVYLNANNATSGAVTLSVAGASKLVTNNTSVTASVQTIVPSLKIVDLLVFKPTTGTYSGWLAVAANIALGAGVSANNYIAFNGITGTNVDWWLGNGFNRSDNSFGLYDATNNKHWVIATPGTGGLLKVQPNGTLACTFSETAITASVQTIVPSLKIVDLLVFKPTTGTYSGWLAVAANIALGAGVSANNYIAFNGITGTNVDWWLGNGFNRSDNSFGLYDATNNKHWVIATPGTGGLLKVQPNGTLACTFSETAITASAPLSQITSTAVDSLMTIQSLATQSAYTQYYNGATRVGYIGALSSSTNFYALSPASDMYVGSQASDKSFHVRMNSADVFNVTPSGITVASGVTPVVDNNVGLGGSSFRFTSVWAVNGTIQTSDITQKTDVTPSPLGLDFINGLEPIAYRFIVGGNTVSRVSRGTTQRSAGVDAEGVELFEEVEEFDDVVTPVPGKRRHFGFSAQGVKALADKHGTDFGGYIAPTSEGDLHGLRYDEFISPMVKAMQEMSAKMEAMEKRIAELESRVSTAP